MSKPKTPQEKKRVSLERDRRNVYGESPHASRNSIPKSKARRHRNARRAENEMLAGLEGSLETDVLDEAEAKVRTRGRLKRRKGFRKVPDEPLGDVIVRKRTQRKKLEGRRKQGGKKKTIK